MWASAPTNNHGKTPDFEGGQSRPPLQRAMMNRNVFRFSPRRGRCPHRPAGNARFMAVFRRIRVGLPFRAVGADDPVRPPELPGFMEIRCEIAAFQWADVGIGPYKQPRKNAGF